MPIPNGIRTPDTYIDVNLNAQRTGLPANVHKVLFITPDNQPAEQTTPLNIYDKAGADTKFGANSIAGRMITAAIKTNRTVDVQCLGKLQASQHISCAGASSNAVIDYDPNLHYKITINNEVVLNINKIDLNDSGEPELNPHLQKLLNLVYLQGIKSDGTESWDALDFGTGIFNDNLRISVEAFNVIGLDGGGQVNHPASIFVPKQQENYNQTLTYENQDAEGGYSKVSFCLSPPT